VSIGAAEYRYGEELDETIGRPDRALYAAKSGGRDRVVTEEAVEGVVAPAEQT
jgi:diguanylate cyclase